MITCLGTFVANNNTTPFIGFGTKINEKMIISHFRDAFEISYAILSI